MCGVVVNAQSAIDIKTKKDHGDDTTLFFSYLFIIFA